MRLFFGVFVCWYAGSVVATLMNFFSAEGRENWPAVVGLSGAALVCLGFSLYFASRQFKLERFLREMALLLVCFYAGIVLGAYAHRFANPSSGVSAEQISVSALSFQGAALLLTVPFLREHRLTWSEAFGFGNRRRDAALAGVAAACLFLPIGWALQHFSALLLEYLQPLGLETHEQVAVQVLRTSTTQPERIKLALVTIVLAPLAEEVLFRGILFTGVRQLGFPRLAFWGTGVVFAFVHFNVVSFLPLFVLALVLAWLYERTGNLLASIAAHSFFNALNFALLFLFKGVSPVK